MGIGPIGSYSGLYGAYGVQNIKTVDIETVKEQDARKLAEEENSYQPAVAEAEAQSQQRQKPNADLQDISLTFNQADDFGYIGQDASLAGLDMEKAISDMKKDEVLQQYNYFVGSAQNMITGTADGTVIRK